VLPVNSIDGITHVACRVKIRSFSQKASEDGKMILSFQRIRVQRCEQNGKQCENGDEQLAA
jgi:hypothetical protein